MGTDTSKDAVQQGGPLDITLLLSWPAATGFKGMREVSLPRTVVCEGPRRSKVLQNIIASDYATSTKDDTICIQVEIAQETNRVFPLFLKYITGKKRFGISDSDKAAFAELVDQFGVDASDLEDDRERQGDSSTVKDQNETDDSKHQDDSSPVKNRTETPTEADSDTMEENSPSFDDLPKLLRLIKQDGNDVEREKAKDSLSSLLTKPGLEVMEIAKTGAVSCLLQILSDEKFQHFQLDSVALLEKMVAQDHDYSETLASRLLSYLAVETFITSQIVHGLKIRRHAIHIIGHMARHSEALCHAVLAKDDCLEYILKAYLVFELRGAAAFTVGKFCHRVPRKMLHQHVFDKFYKGLDSGADDYTVNLTCTSFTNLALAMTPADCDSCSMMMPLQELFRDHGSKFCRVRKFRTFLDMSHMPSILDSLCRVGLPFQKLGLPFKKLLEAVSCGDDREYQLLGCEIIAVLVRYTRIKRLVTKGGYAARQNEIFSVLSKLISYGGQTKIPAAKAFAEVLRYSDLEQVDVKPGPITAICNVMRDCLGNNDNMLLFQSIFMGLQRVLKSKSAHKNHDFTVLIGVQLAEIMTMKSADMSAPNQLLVEE